jgi:CspA family cold shock protein
MAKKVTGEVAQFGTKGYGFITGDDGEQYFAHQKNIYNKSRLKIGTRVIFNTENSDKGWVATDIQLVKGAKDSADSKPLSSGTVKGLFVVLFIAQALVIYKVFLG